MVAQLLRLFLTVKNTRKTFPTSGESVRDHIWDNGDLTETVFDTDGEWQWSLRPNPKILSQRGRNPGVNGVLLV